MLHHIITWEDLRSELEDWAISAQFDFKAHKDKSRAVYVCKHESSRYHWRLMASSNKAASASVSRCLGVRNSLSQLARSGIDVSKFALKFTKYWGIYLCQRKSLSHPLSVRQCSERTDSYLFSSQPGVVILSESEIYIPYIRVKTMSRRCKSCVSST